MYNLKYKTGAHYPFYSTAMHSPEDSCWNKVCPGYDKTTKLNCFVQKSNDICDCCGKIGIKDCEVLIPGAGIVNACEMQKIKKLIKDGNGNIMFPNLLGDNGNGNGSPIVPPPTPTPVSDDNKNWFGKNFNYIMIVLLIIILIMIGVGLFMKNKGKKRRRK